MGVRQIAARLLDLIFFIFIWGITPVLALMIVPSIHESGHAAACLIEGDAVTQWQLNWDRWRRPRQTIFCCRQAAGN